MAILPRRVLGRVPVRWRRALVAGARTVMAATGAWAFASVGLHDREPVLAPLVAVLTVQGTVVATVRKAAEVSAGVMLGAGIGVALGAVAGDHWWTIAAVTALGVSTRHLPGLRAGAADQLTISALLVVALGQGYGYARVVDTAIGALAGIIVVFVVLPPVRIPESVEVLTDLAADVVGVLRSMADGVRAEWHRQDAVAWLERARNLDNALARARSSLAEAQESLRWNPRRVPTARERPLGEAGDALEHVVGQVRAVARGLADLASDEQREPLDPPTLPEAYPRLLSCAADTVDAFRRCLREQADAREVVDAIHEGRAEAEGLDAVDLECGARRQRIWGSLTEEPVRLLGELSPSGAHHEAYS